MGGLLASVDPNMDFEDVRSAQYWNAWVVPKGFSASDRDASLGSQSLRRARAEARRYSLGKLLRHVNLPMGMKRDQMLFGKPGVIHT